MAIRWSPNCARAWPTSARSNSHGESAPWRRRRPARMKESRSDLNSSEHGGFRAAFREHRVREQQRAGDRRPCPPGRPHRRAEDQAMRTVAAGRVCSTLFANRSPGSASAGPGPAVYHQAAGDDCAGAGAVPPDRHPSRVSRRRVRPLLAVRSCRGNRLIQQTAQGGQDGKVHGRPGAD